jgi:hypothetical protein
MISRRRAFHRSLLTPYRLNLPKVIHVVSGKISDDIPQRLHPTLGVNTEHVPSKRLSLS